MMTMTARIKEAIKKCKDRLPNHIPTVENLDPSNFNTKMDDIVKAAVQQVFNEVSSRDMTQLSEDQKVEMQDRILSRINGDGGIKRNLDKLKSNYSNCAHVAKVLANEIKQESRAHLWEQVRLFIFRTATAVGIATALIYMGLLANNLGVKIGIPFSRLIQ